MSVATELLAQNMPLATGEVMGVNPAYFLGVAALAGAAYQAKKIIPTWHHTINKGEVGVLLRQGKPVERHLTDEQIEAGESKYKILQPNFYLVPPFRTIQTVYVTDQLDPVYFPLDSDDGPQVEVHANVTWNVSPKGDNPVRSITEVMHQKIDKKESTPSPADDTNRLVLKNRVLGLCAVALSQTLTGRTAKELKTINKDSPDEVQQETIERCMDDVTRYGAVISAVELMQITRVGEQVLGELFVVSQNSGLAAAALASQKVDAEGNGNGHRRVVSLHHGDDAA